MPAQEVGLFSATHAQWTLRQGWVLKLLEKRGKTRDFASWAFENPFLGGKSAREAFFEGQNIFFYLTTTG